MKKITVMTVIFIVAACLIVIIAPKRKTRQAKPGHSNHQMLREIKGIIKKGDTLSGLFTRNKLPPADIGQARQATDGVYDLGRLCSGRPYRIIVDDEERLHSLTYWINDETYLNVFREGGSLRAALEENEYERRLISFGGVIKDNLIISLGPGKDALLLALDLSDVFAWDIDFNTDLRDGDTFRVVVEGLYLESTFRKFGHILAAELVNDGTRFSAYRFENNGLPEYFDALGNPLKKAFLKAPLNFRRISSSFTGKRYHPILKRYKPHRGVDYAAATGTAVSALGDGTVGFTGYSGGYGKLVIVRHKNGYSTYYGHLSRIPKGIRKNAAVAQGDVIGYVGSTGLATGPHLHFEMRVAGKPVNPFSVKLAGKRPIPAEHRDRFMEFVGLMDGRLAAAPVIDGPPLPSAFAGRTIPKEG